MLSALKSDGLKCFPQITDLLFTLLHSIFKALHHNLALFYEHKLVLVVTKPNIYRILLPKLVVGKFEEGKIPNATI